MDLTGKNVLIFGKGSSGISAGIFVNDNGGAAYVYDDFDYSPCELKQISFSEVIRQMPRFDFGILSPGISSDNRLIKTLKQNNFTLISELDFAYLQSNAKIIAVTGTNGKTTTVSLTAEMLKNAGYKAAAVGNIGVPFINWCKWLGENDAAVVEVSSFQLEQSQCFCSDIATITNITPDHIERHGTMENYIEIKKSIFKNTKEMAVMNSEEQYEVKCKKFIYSLSDENADLFVKDGIIYYRTDEELIDVISIEDLKIKGDHNILNALCALSLAICFSGGCSECFADTLRKYNLPKYRIECLGEVCGMNVFNDSKGTNIGATICAIKSMRGDTVLIMGGYDKLDDYTLFFKTLDPKIKHILLCGANTLAVLNGAKNAEKDNIIEVFEDINSAVTNAFQYTDCNNLLFSPATSSFDVYYDYKQRGKVFEELINAKRQSQ